MGKGSRQRLDFITREAYELQWNLAFGKISFEEYEKKRTKLMSESKWWKKS